MSLIEDVNLDPPRYNCPKIIETLYWVWVEYATARREAKRPETQRQQDLYQMLILDLNRHHIKRNCKDHNQRRWLHTSIENYLRDINDSERKEDSFRQVYLQWWKCRATPNMFEMAWWDRTRRGL